MRHSDLRKLSTDRLREELGRKTREYTQFDPRPFQLDGAVALCQGKDVTVRAGTGFGKTLIMVMPSFLSSKIISVIISPLNAIEEDQVSCLVTGNL